MHLGLFMIQREGQPIQHLPGQGRGVHPWPSDKNTFRFPGQTLGLHQYDLALAQDALHGSIWFSIPRGPSPWFKYAHGITEQCTPRSAMQRGEVVWDPTHGWGRKGIAPHPSTVLGGGVHLTRVLSHPRNNVMTLCTFLTPWSITGKREYIGKRHAVLTNEVGCKLFYLYL